MTRQYGGLGVTKLEGQPSNTTANFLSGGGDTGPDAGEILDRNSSVNFDELYKQRSICTYQTYHDSVRDKNPNVSETYFLDYRTIEFVVLSFVFCQNF